MIHYLREWSTRDGVSIFGQGWRPEHETRAVVCLIHGLGEHSGRYDHVATALTKSGFALHACDLRGHGRSAGARGHTPSYAALLDDIGLLMADAMATYGDLPQFLYGHSLGGNLVLNCGIERTVANGQIGVSTCAGVVATGPWLRLAMNPPRAKIILGKIMDKVMPTFVQPSGLDVSALSHDPQVVRDYRDDPLVHDRISARLGVALLDAGERALACASAFPLPLLLMHGGADRLTSALASQEFADRVALGCTFRIWDGLYHEIHNEPEKAEVLRYMTNWLTDHLPE